jgi:NADPH-dependent 2,4-dienoyl-CoA reductase/sulfur reductase-like enzyme
MHLVMIGGSDAGISAALRARELNPDADVTVVAADAYPNFSICGIPYYLSGEVTHWRNLAHRTIADLEAAGMWLRLDTPARSIDVAGRKLLVTSPGEAVGLVFALIPSGCPQGRVARGTSHPLVSPWHCSHSVLRVHPLKVRSSIVLPEPVGPSVQ